MDRGYTIPSLNWLSSFLVFFSCDAVFFQPCAQVFHPAFFCIPDHDEALRTWLSRNERNLICRVLLCLEFNIGF